MLNRRRLPWIIFALCAIAVAEGLGWVTYQAIQLEGRERRARAGEVFQETIREALWRMDSRVNTVIAQESVRPYFQYRSFYPAERAYTRMWQEVTPGEVLVPSPLLEFAGEFVRLHFEIGPDGAVASPQAPAGAMRELAQSAGVNAASLVYADTLLERLGAMMPRIERATAATGRVPAAEPGPDRSQGRLLDEAAAGERRSAAASSAEDEAKLQTPKDLLKRAPSAPSGEPARDQQEQPTEGQSLRQSPEYLVREEAARQARSTPPNAQRQLAAGKSREIAVDAADAKQKPAATGPEDRQDARGGRAGETDKLDAKSTDPPARSPAASRSERPAGPAATPLAIAPGEAGGVTPAMEDRQRNEAGEGRREADKLDPGGTGRAAPANEAFAEPAHEGGGSGAEFNGMGGVGGDPELSSFEPRWVRAEDGSPQLILEREVSVGGVGMVQGLWLDWPALRGRLLAIVRPALPLAELEPQPLPLPPDEPGNLLLASIPVRLSPGPVPQPAVAWATPTNVTLGVTWLLVLAAITAIGMVLRQSVQLSDRRGRFVSAVTHELRTPLTTFCLYTEMLDGGMVKDESARAGYVSTLRRESSRLARIVENVLDYARLGRRARLATPERPVAAREIAERLRPMLTEHAAKGGMDLALEIEGAGCHQSAALGRLVGEGGGGGHGPGVGGFPAPVASEQATGGTRGAGDMAGDVLIAADPSLIERIVFNLVDNACKYAADAADKRVHVTMRVVGHGGPKRFTVRQGSRFRPGRDAWPDGGDSAAARRPGRTGVLEIAVRDHGPGVPRGERRRVFQPFHRARRDEESSRSGLGLGLALARGLARELGGDLVLRKPDGEGAEFVVTLPMVADPATGDGERSGPTGPAADA